MITTPRKHFDVDTLGRNIAHMAAMARAMPPAYLGAGVREPIYSQGGRRIGHVLDGKGIYLDTDLKSLGLTKGIPHVYERSLTQRILDKLGREEGAITTYDGIINARANSNFSDVMVNKSSYTTVANTWSTTYRAAGMPVAGTYAGTPGAAKNRTDAGALSLGISDPGSGNSYLLTFGIKSDQQLNMVLLVDLLVAVGAVTAASNAAQTVSSAALGRYTDGAGVYMTLEVTTALGGTAANLTSSYTNQAGTAGQTSTSQAMTTSAITQRLQPAVTGPQIALASGDYGVRAVSTTTLSASMTAGVYAVLLYKPLLWMPGAVANIYDERDSGTTISGLVQLPVDSGPHIGCLTTYIFTNATTAGTQHMTMRTVWG